MLSKINSLNVLCLSTIVLLEVTRAQECQYKNEDKAYRCKNVVDIFPSMYYGNYKLVCVGCNITTFTDETFPFQNSLTSFNASGCGVKEIKPLAFSAMTRLQYLFLHNNRIDHVAENAFSGVKRLYELRLENNALKTLIPGFLNDFQSNLVNLSDNFIAKLPNGAFKGSESVLILDLSNNDINAVDVDAFVGLSDLEELELSNNRLCHLKLGVFESLKFLRRLNLADNKFTRFPLGVFSGLTNLNYLIIANNSLDMLNGGVLLPFMHLLKLDVSGNGMYIFDAHDIYVNVPSVKFLSIEDNIFSCTLLKNTLQYFKLKGITVENNINRYQHHNINGIACIDDYVITERIALGYFLEKAKNTSQLLVSYC
ncbi:leucine-rich repeat-containing protein 15-like [Cylas formicarius]|uniref:leucine-rich repeat-containing protein 15-like n=1 Tax=Cylas formicarius TaxID=197179 RepID=UPI00295879CB|nr:leucine-rich repeat-containing protein 15-like [Cylas formicarius]